MIMADSFSRSIKARNNEFSTNYGKYFNLIPNKTKPISLFSQTIDDTPLIAQFATKDVSDIYKATEYIYPYVDGVDLNCGCPQRWAVSTGYGCSLLTNPELIKDIVGTIRRNFNSNFSISVKIRLLNDNVKSTIELCRQLEMCDVTFLTVHGRTPFQKTSHPVNIEAIADIKKSIKIPLIANGDIKSLEDAENIHSLTNCNGVMTARGILANPTIFTGTTVTPISCIQNWLNIVTSAGDTITFQCLHHHLTFMMEKLLSRKQRVIFNNFTKKQQVFDFLNEYFDLRPETNSVMLNDIVCEYSDSESIVKDNPNMYSSDNTKGVYFNSKIEKNDNFEFDFMESSLFD